MADIDGVVRSAESPVSRAAVEVIRVEKRKYPDRLRTIYQAHPLGHDRWGEWLTVPAERAVLLLPSSEWWVAWFREDGSLRVDIAGDVVAGGFGGTNRGVRSFIDLDLDIECAAGGALQILDEDQFAERCWAYPASYVDAARWAVGDAADRVQGGDEPFGQACRPWTGATGWPGADTGAAVA